MELKLYTIDTVYVDFLRMDSKLSKVFDNKDDSNAFTRKYVGVVLNIGGYKYYVPLSSPKNTDFIVVDNIRRIRKNIIPIIRITAKDKEGNLELKGTLKFSNMIPVPDEVITYYDISKEADSDYKILVEKEYEFIKKNQVTILRNASVLYNQKIKEKEFFPEGKKKPGYLESVIDFKYAERVCDMYLK